MNLHELEMPGTQGSGAMGIEPAAGPAPEVILIESAGSSAWREMFKQKYPFPPVGILSISSFLKLHGYRVHVIDLMMEDHTREGFRARLRGLSRQPAAVGISVYTDCFAEGMEVAATVRDVFPDTRIVVGGPHATFRPEEVLSHPAVDFVIRHEGEAALVELLEHVRRPSGLDLEQIASLSYRGEDGAVRSNPARPFLTHLDPLPLPDYEALPALADSYRDSFLFVSSRGCPGDCIFCASRALSGGRYRFHSAEWIFSLAYEYFHRYRFNRMVFLDDTFTVHRRRARAFCRYLRTSWPDDRPPRWACKSRVDCLDDDICEEIARAGCLAVHIGVESADRGVLEAIAKHIRLEQVYAAIRSARRWGIRVDCSFIIGHHADTLETIEKTVLFAQAIRDSGIGTAVLGISTPFPGTRLAQAAEELGVEITVKNWGRYTLTAPVYHTRNFTENDLRRAVYFYDHESRRGRSDVGLTSSDHAGFRAELARFLDEVRAVEPKAETAMVADAPWAAGAGPAPVGSADEREGRSRR